MEIRVRAWAWHLVGRQRLAQEKAEDNIAWAGLASPSVALLGLAWGRQRRFFFHSGLQPRRGKRIANHA